MVEVRSLVERVPTKHAGQQHRGPEPIDRKPGDLVSLAVDPMISAGPDVQEIGRAISHGPDSPAIALRVPPTGSSYRIFQPAFTTASNGKIGVRISGTLSATWCALMQVTTGMAMNGG